MSGFFKSFGRGILYVIFLPFIVLCLALYSVIGVFILIFLTFKSIILFFKAKTIFSPLEEDEQANLILHKSKNIQQKIIANQTSGQTVSENKTTNNIFILSKDQLQNVNKPQDIIDQIDNTPLEIEHREELPISDNDETIHIERNNMNNENKISHDDELFLEEPIPHEDEIEKVEETRNSTINISSKDNYYKPKDTSINEDDYDFSYDDEDENKDRSSGVTINEYKGEEDD